MPCIFISNKTPPAPVSGDIQIGTGTTNITRYPVRFYYDYSVSAHIFTSTELSSIAGKTITRIEYEMLNTSNGVRTVNNQTFKCGHTTDTEFQSSLRADLSNMVNLTDLTTVKSNFSWTLGLITPDPEWQGITFDTNFVYDGTKNLMIYWLNSDGSYAPGTLSSPAALKLDLAGTQPFNSFYRQQDITPITNQYVTRDSTGRPNIKIFYQ